MLLVKIQNEVVEKIILNIMLTKLECYINESVCTQTQDCVGLALKLSQGGLDILFMPLGELDLNSSTGSTES